MTPSRQKQKNIQTRQPMPPILFFSAAPDHAFTTPNALPCRLACPVDTTPFLHGYLTSPTNSRGGILGPSNFVKTDRRKKKSNSPPNFAEMAARADPLPSSALISPRRCAPGTPWSGPSQRIRGDTKRPPPRLCSDAQMSKLPHDKALRLCPFHHIPLSTAIGLHRARLSRSHLTHAHSRAGFVIDRSLLFSLPLGTPLASDAKPVRIGLLMIRSVSTAFIYGAKPARTFTLSSIWVVTSSMFFGDKKRRISSFWVAANTTVLARVGQVAFFLLISPLAFFGLIWLSASLYPPLLPLYYCTKKPTCYLFLSSSRTLTRSCGNVSSTEDLLIWGDGRNEDMGIGSHGYISGHFALATHTID
jgi:hypothetical protein